MMKNIKYLVTAIVLVTLIISCVDKHTEVSKINQEKSTDTKPKEEVEKNLAESHDNEEHQTESLFLTKEQMETIGIEFGDFSSIKVNDYIKATGTLGLPPNAYASVSAKSAGVIKSTKKFVEGKYIKQGEFIAYLENPDFIALQQEFLETQAKLKLKWLDLARQQALIDANAGVTRDLQRAQSEVSILEAKLAGLSKQLSYLGISTENLTPNSISQQISIVSPMSGYISNINIHNGMYAQPTVSLMEIISDKHLHLELDVFEKDIANVKIGQKISYTIPALGPKIYQGEVSVIGKEFDSKTKTVRVHGHIEGEKPLFIKDLFINAKIWINDDTVRSIPDQAIIKDGKNSFIYVAEYKKNAEKIKFIPIGVITGATNNGYTAVKVLEEIPSGMQIVTNGAYYVYAQSQAGEMEHEH